MKKISALFLTFILIFSMIPTTALAASNEATNAADVLNGLGLFDGTGTDENGNPVYDLEKAPTRLEAVTMLVRLLGKGDEAVNGKWDTPFTDVANWAKPYVGYAYANGLASGTSKTTFGGNDKVTAAQYITFVLRALGYESGVDFTWNKAWELSDEIGLTDGRYNENTKSFLRSDIAIISASALNSNPKDSECTLFENMKENGVLKQDASMELTPQKLNYTYCEDFNKDYIKSAFVTKIGDRYQFEFVLTPNHFEDACFFPAEYQTNDGSDDQPAGYTVFIELESSTNADIARFSIDKDYLFKNPINRNEMVFQAEAIPEAFSNDAHALKNLIHTHKDVIEYRIDVFFETSQLPR